VARKGVWLAAICVVVSNAVGLGFAWWNRSGDVESELRLTEREVRVRPRETENTAITLEMAWIDPSRAPGASPWLDKAKLVELGFDCSVAPTRDNALFYRGQMPRAAYVALEYEGDSWTRYLASIPPGPDRESAMAGSHLVVVDVGLDAGALRRRHPNRRGVVVAPGTVALDLRRTDPNATPALVGHATIVYPLEVSVPTRLRSVFDGLAEANRGPYEPRQGWRGVPLSAAPRYEVALRWGRTLEPWLAEAGRMSPPPRVDAR
jgi:hypothetical protein